MRNTISEQPFGIHEYQKAALIVIYRTDNVEFSGGNLILIRKNKYEFKRYSYIIQESPNPIWTKW